MATNYTTKTAALKATKADMRQVAVSKKIEIGSGDTATQITDSKVSAEDLFVSVDGKEDRQSVKALIQQAQEDATNAAGIQVTRDLNGDYDNADPDEFLSVKTKKMNFYGTYVNVVQSTTNPDEISIYIGENKNPAEFSTVTAPNGTGMYLYTASDYSLGAATAGSKYETCQTGGTETVYAVKSGEVITIPNTTSTVKVEAVDNSGVSIASCETGVIDGSQAKVEASNGGIAITVSEIHKNTPDDAKDGMTPGFIRCKISATLTNATIMPKGGYYKVKMTVAGKSNTNDTGIFIYNAGSSTPSVAKVEAVYESTGTKTVSGITYDNGAKVKLNVTGIKDTQSMATNDLTRVTISDNSNGRLDDIGALKVANLTAANETSKTAANAEFSYSKEVTFTKNHTPAIMSGKYTATPYTWNNSTYANGKAEGSFAGTRYLWNGDETADSDKLANFHTDGTRLAYTVEVDTEKDIVTGLDVTSTASFDSAKSLATDYPQQLLIQGGYLKHPGATNMDVTKTYNSTSCPGTRYYTKLIKLNSSTTDRGGTDIKLTIPGLGGLNSTDIKVWAVNANAKGSDGVGDKAIRIDADGANGGCAKSYASNILTFSIGGGDMLITENNMFYLVIQMAATCTKTIGAISVA